jgi:hypothetical protein
MEKERKTHREKEKSGVRVIYDLPDIIRCLMPDSSIPVIE